MVVVIVVVVEGAFLGRRWRLCFGVDVEVVGVGVVVGVGRCCLSVVALALHVGHWRCCLWSLVVGVGRWTLRPLWLLPLFPFLALFLLHLRYGWDVVLCRVRPSSCKNSAARAVPPGPLNEPLAEGVV